MIGNGSTIRKISEYARNTHNNTTCITHTVLTALLNLYTKYKPCCLSVYSVDISPSSTFIGNTLDVSCSDTRLACTIVELGELVLVFTGIAVAYMTGISVVLTLVGVEGDISFALMIYLTKRQSNMKM